MPKKIFKKIGLKKMKKFQRSRHTLHDIIIANILNDPIKKSVSVCSFLP